MLNIYRFEDPIKGESKKLSCMKIEDEKEVVYDQHEPCMLFVKIDLSLVSLLTICINASLPLSLQCPTYIAFLTVDLWSFLTAIDTDLSTPYPHLIK